MCILHLQAYLVLLGFLLLCFAVIAFLVVGFVSFQSDGLWQPSGKQIW